MIWIDDGLLEQPTVTHDDSHDGISASDNGCVDESCLRQLVEDLGGDFEELNALVTIYLDQGASRVQSAVASWTRGDIKGLQYVLHDLKSSSAMFGVFGVSRIAAGLEASIRDGQVLETDIRALEAAFAASVSALPSACARLPG